MAEAHIRLTDIERSNSEVVNDRSSFDGKNVKKNGLAFDEIREEEIQEEVQDRKGKRKYTTDALCDNCLMHNLINLCTNTAFYLCYLCEQYLCNKCFKEHINLKRPHKYINSVSEKSERDSQIDILLYDMMNESESEREEMFEKLNVSMVEKVDVKVSLDRRYCRVHGICGLNNKMWVICDSKNKCIKLFNVGSNHLQKYIQLGSSPWGVTEIKVNREPTEQVLITTSDISVTNRAEPQQSRLAVTLPERCRILIIDVTQTPAIVTTTIKTEKLCRSIDFSEDTIVFLCYDDERHGPWSVSVMSTDGVMIKTINTDLHPKTYPSPYLAVFPGRFYITDPHNDKVLCLDDEGNVVFHKTITLKWPHGITVDPDSNKVFICSWHQHKLYRFDTSLESLETIVDLESVHSEDPRSLLLYRDKLYVSHDRFTHQNCVTIVRIL